jgi:hypothetical protein
MFLFTVKERQIEGFSGVGSERSYAVLIDFRTIEAARHLRSGFNSLLVVSK